MMSHIRIPEHLPKPESERPDHLLSHVLLCGTAVILFILCWVRDSGILLIPLIGCCLGIIDLLIDASVWDEEQEAAKRSLDRFLTRFAQVFYAEFLNALMFAHKEEMGQLFAGNLLEMKEFRESVVAQHPSLKPLIHGQIVSGHDTDYYYKGKWYYLRITVDDWHVLYQNMGDEHRAKILQLVRDYVGCRNRKDVYPEMTRLMPLSKFRKWLRNYNLRLSASVQPC